MSYDQTSLPHFKLTSMHLQLSLMSIKLVEDYVFRLRSTDSRDRQLNHVDRRNLIMQVDYLKQEDVHEPGKRVGTHLRTVPCNNSS